MRLFAGALAVAWLLLMAPAPVAAQDRVGACRSLSDRGKVWADCCAQSYARNPARVITRNTRLHQIERCVRNRLRADVL